MRVFQEHLQIRTRGKGFVDISAELGALVQRSGIRTGLATLFLRHTSASLVIQENADPAVLRDLERWFDDLAPASRQWEHADEGPDDMPAHARSVLTRSSETIPVSNGRLVLGTWQAVYVWEHRRLPHSRHVVVHVQGE